MNILVIGIVYLVIGYAIGCIAEAAGGEEKGESWRMTTAVLWPLLITFLVVIVVGSTIAYIPVKIIERVKECQRSDQ